MCLQLDFSLFCLCQNCGFKCCMDKLNVVYWIYVYLLCHLQLLASLEALYTSIPKIKRSKSEPTIHRTDSFDLDFKHMCASPKTPINSQFTSKFLFSVLNYWHYLTAGVNWSSMWYTLLHWHITLSFKGRKIHVILLCITGALMWQW